MITPSEERLGLVVYSTVGTKFVFRNAKIISSSEKELFITYCHPRHADTRIKAVIQLQNVLVYEWFEWFDS